ncbi:MAG: transglutaminase family protein [Bacteroidales bacterium]
MTIDNELKSLIILMEDPDPVVKNAVVRRMVERGEESIQVAERELSYRSRESSQYVESVLNEVKWEFTYKRLEELFKAPQPKLDESLFWITKLVDPLVDYTIFSNGLEKLVEEVVGELTDQKSAVEKVNIYNYLFFKKFKFHHNDIGIENIEYALIDRSLLSRGGNPVMITIIYLLIAQKSGIPLYPLCFLGGFVPVYLNPKGEILFYLNIFREGLIFGEDTLRQFFTDLQLTYNPKSFSLEQERALVSIYMEMLYYILTIEELNSKGERIKRAMGLLGSKRYL